MGLPQVFKYRGREVYKIRNNLIHYGNPDDKFVAVFVVLGIEEYKGYKIASPISVELQINNPKLTVRERVVKKAEADNLYKALELAHVWLVQANGK
ncbi:hypothetical protein Calkro_2105 [Caldicellulosiruptor kronotskyensis 2002]|uniref:Uncharacterized protein n=1 Tax=Caldicellulosiruptor kronotskyensis (strain DSM 18902 / VKM B-2412 / 2002) TaxID=632348 RepID=E4SGS3_CALK2|nr:hypothetical protein [Caldicellulosiruptor kronotskyensis]ADQ46948.1 hypothetical protein Calkro_2105 [Caldicellulosiruptor kronotskyensis 2002]